MAVSVYVTLAVRSDDARDVRFVAIVESPHVDPSAFGADGAMDLARLVFGAGQLCFEMCYGS